MKLTQAIVEKTLNWGYDKALNGAPGLDTAEELAESHLKKGGTKDELVGSLIKWQITKAGTAGFVSGLGGLLALPVTLPTNLASVMFIQIRMIAAIAYIGEYDLSDKKVKSLVFACLVGNKAFDLLRDVGISVGEKVTIQLVSSISVKTIQTINQRVGFQLLAKAGEKGLINVSKAVPLVGGIIGGSIDSISTNIIGQVARKAFIQKNGGLIEGNNDIQIAS